MGHRNWLRYTVAGAGVVYLGMQLYEVSRSGRLLSICQRMRASAENFVNDHVTEPAKTIQRELFQDNSETYKMNEANVRARACARMSRRGPERA